MWSEHSKQRLQFPVVRDSLNPEIWDNVAQPLRSKRIRFFF